MGIPENFVRRCSGHKNLRTMAPYMGVGIEAQTLEMDRWNRSQYRSQIVSILDKMNESELKLILNAIKDPDRLLEIIKLIS